MDLTYPPEAEAFRLEVRAWLEQNLPEGWGSPGFKLTPEERVQFDKEWTPKLAEGGWICASWPKEYGGRGLSVMESVALNEEFARLNAPMRADFFGDTLVGPTILQWGTEEQKSFFLPKILRGEISWCQGFSEPDAGSDLASLKTRAELDGDEWVINGQKVWTTQAQYADYVFLLCRTDLEAPQHKGISYLLVPMRQSGIEVRPIAQMDGSAEFNEVFFNNARCPRDSVVGGVNNGWQIAMTTLGFERGTSATTGYRRFQKELDQIIAAARGNGKVSDPLIRQRLALSWSKVKIMQINGLRSLTAALNEDSSASALGATHKMFWSEYHRDVMELAIDILGMDGQILTGDGKAGAGAGDFVAGVGVRHLRPGYPVSALQTAFFFSRSETIWGGTAQIQRNIVAERVLGLPKEPRPELKASGKTPGSTAPGSKAASEAPGSKAMVTS
jgi:alkylation response protein AidB-like acyl-CoA dehydrogenase